MQIAPFSWVVGGVAVVHIRYVAVLIPDVLSAKQMR